MCYFASFYDGKLFFLSNSFMKARSLPLNYSLKIKTCIMLSKLDIFSSNSPPHPSKIQILYLSSRDNSQMSMGHLEGGGGGVLVHFSKGSCQHNIMTQKIGLEHRWFSQSQMNKPLTQSACPFNKVLQTLPLN